MISRQRRRMFAPLLCSGIAARGGAAAVTFSLALTDHKEVTVDGTTITYSAASFGAADANRIIVAAVCNRPTGPDTISSFTIGGVSATQIVAARVLSVDETMISEIWYAAVPTGTAGDVVVTWSANSQRSTCAVYRVITTTPVPNNAGSATAGTGAGVSKALTIPSGGGGIAIYGNRGPGNANDVSWTNATKDYTAINVETTLTGGSATVAATNTVSASISGSGVNTEVISVAAWAP